MKRTLTRWIKVTPLGGVATWMWRHVTPAPPPMLPENENERMYSFMRGVLREDSNCVDVGASFGGFLEQMLAIAPRGTHHAFEPIPQLADDLKRKYPSAHIHAMALSDCSGMLKFHYFPDLSPFSGLERRRDIASDERTQVMDVPVAKLDDVLPAAHPVALIKIDVEGAELKALHGAEQTLRQWRPPVILEHDTAPAQIYGGTSEALWAFLADQLEYELTTSVRALEGAQALQRDEFLSVTAEGKICNFIALRRPADL